MPGTDALTLQEAADALGVHYMTAYRYVRLGLLPAHRSGRAWVVDRADLEAFRRDRDTPAGDASASPKRRVDWAQRLERRLLAGDRLGAMGVVEGALAAGSSPIDVYVDVVAPAMRSIGDGWASGAVDVAVEHRASVIMGQVLAVLGARFTRRGVSRGVILVGAAPGERHSLPIRLVADVIRLSGYEVEDLGADVPADSFAFAAARADRLLAVGVSSSTSGNDDAVGGAIDAIRTQVQVPVFVGGGAVAGLDSAQTLGADHWAPDARSFVEVLGSITNGR